MEDRLLDEANKAAREETKCDISMDATKEEASWYSLMNVISLCLGSGMGRQFDDAGSRELLSWTGINWDDLPQKNPSPLEAVFKSGDPHLTKEFDLWNLDTWHWSPGSFDRTLVPQAQGWTMIAETEFAKWFEMPHKNQSVPDDVRRAWRAYGQLFWGLARKQCDLAFNNMRNDKGLFCTAVDGDSMDFIEPGTELADQACMLWACSDIAALSAQQDSMYANDDSRRCFMDFADQLFQAIVDNKNDLLRSSDNPILAQSIAIPALVWYASTTEAQDLKARCFWLMREFADNLVKAQDQNEMVGNTLIDAAAALRALSEAFRITRLRTYAETATKIFNFMESQWWVLHGVYPPTPEAREFTYNADDVGIVLGALNVSRWCLGDRIDRDLADLRLRVFFCKAVNISGLQMSMPSPGFMPDWLRQREPDDHFRYATIPMPSEAGGQIGIAPVMAGEIGYDPQTQTWSRNNLFDAPAAMHACCEFLWINREAINGFPEVKLEHAPTAVQEAANQPPIQVAKRADWARDVQYEVDGSVEG
jgi:hypothetical protein